LDVVVVVDFYYYVAWCVCVVVVVCDPDVDVVLVFYFVLCESFGYFVDDGLFFCGVHGVLILVREGGY